MGKIGVFNYVTVDGFFAGPNGETDWFYSIPKDKEFEEFTHNAAGTDSTLIFGRTTYEMMKSYWPTPDAEKNDPEMAKSLRESPKIVFSKTLNAESEKAPNWKNITVIPHIKLDEILRMKEEAGNMMVLGSGSVVQKLTDLGLIDEYSLVVVPVILGTGKPLFKDVNKLDLKLLSAQPFKNGVVLQNYGKG